MKIFKSLPSSFLLLVVLLLPFYTQTAHKSGISNAGVVQSVMNTNQLLTTIVENAWILVAQIKNGTRNVVAKKQALNAIDTAEKDLAADIKKLLNPHITVIKEESARFFDNSAHNSRRAEDAAAAILSEVEKLTQRGSETVVKKTTTDIEDALIKKEKIESDATAKINQIRQQLALGKITELKAARLIVEQNGRINAAEKRLQDLRNKLVAAVQVSDAQVSYFNRFVGGSKALASGVLAIPQAGYFSKEEDKEIARAVIVELEQVKLELTGFYVEAMKRADVSQEDKQLLVQTYQNDIQKIDEEIRQQKIITGDAWSSQRKLFWGTVALVGAAGLGLTASKYLSVPKDLVPSQDEQETVNLVAEQLANEKQKRFAAEAELSGIQTTLRQAQDDRLLADKQRAVEQQIKEDERELAQRIDQLKSAASRNKSNLELTIRVDSGLQKSAEYEKNLVNLELEQARKHVHEVVADRDAFKKQTASQWSYSEDDKAYLADLDAEEGSVNEIIAANNEDVNKIDEQIQMRKNDINSYQARINELPLKLEQDIEKAKRASEAKKQEDIKKVLFEKGKIEEQAAALEAQVKAAQKVVEEQRLAEDAARQLVVKQQDAINLLNAQLEQNAAKEREHLQAIADNLAAQEKAMQEQEAYEAKQVLIRQQIKQIEEDAFEASLENMPKWWVALKRAEKAAKNSLAVRTIQEGLGQIGEGVGGLIGGAGQKVAERGAAVARDVGKVAGTASQIVGEKFDAAGNVIGQVVNTGAGVIVPFIDDAAQAAGITPQVIDQAVVDAARNVADVANKTVLNPEV